MDQTSPTPAPSRFISDKLFVALVLAVFILAGILGIKHHELWRDETQPWLQCRDSASWGQMLHIARYEAHYALWNSLLFVITRLTHDPRGMQILHLGLATLALGIFLVWSPFSRTQKLMYCGGYFILFEYCQISRDYVLILLLSLSLCALLAGRPRHYLLTALWVALLANTNLYGVMLSLLFIFFFGLQWLGVWKEARWKIGVAVTLIAVGFGLSILQMIPPPSSPVNDWKHPLTLSLLGDIFTNIWHGYVPLPTKFPYWPEWGWGTNFMDSIVGSRSLTILLATGLFAAALLSLLPHPRALGFFLLGTIGLLAFQFVVSTGALRHNGFFYLILVMAFWLAEYETPQSPSIPRWAWPRRLRHGLFSTLLGIHLAAGLYAYGIDYHYPFSASRDAAEFLIKNGYSTLPIIGSKEDYVSSTCAYLDRSIYYPDSQRDGSYVLFDKTRKHEASSDEILQKAAELALHSNTCVVLIMQTPFSMRDNTGANSAISVMRIDSSGHIQLPNMPRVLPSLIVSNLAVFSCLVDEPKVLYSCSVEQ